MTKTSGKHKHNNNGNRYKNSKNTKMETNAKTNYDGTPTMAVPMECNTPHQIPFEKFFLYDLLYRLHETGKHALLRKLVQIEYDQQVLKKKQNIL